MADSYLERNAAGLTRLRALAGRLSDAELAVDVGGGWTASVVFAHLAFWDRYLLARWTAAQREGLRQPSAVPDYVPGFINEASAESWRSCPARASVEQALAAAEDVEQAIAALPRDVAEEVLASERPTLVDRTRHWHQHIDQIEAALR